MTNTLQTNSTVTKILFPLLLLAGLLAFSNISYAGTWSASINHPSIPPPIQICDSEPLYATIEMPVGSSCAPDGATYTWGPTSMCDLGGGESSTYQNSNSVQRQTCNPSANNPPIANAGVDRSITQPTTSISIPAGGATASDPDGSVASIVWAFISGPATPTITSGSTLTPTFNGLNNAGAYIFRLTVTDNLGLPNQDTMTVTVNVANPQCNDVNFDNDGDGRADSGDWGCHSDGNPLNAASYVPTDNDESNPYCNVPGWNDPGDLTYDGDISGPGAASWCDNNYPGGRCPSNLSGGPTSVSAKGSGTSCCYPDPGNPYLGWARSCGGAPPPSGGTPPACTYGIQATQTRSAKAQTINYDQYNMGWLSPTCNTNWNAPFMNDSATFARNNGVPESPDVDAMEAAFSWFPQPGAPEEQDATTGNTTRLSWAFDQWQGSQADLIPCTGQITVNVCNPPPSYTLTTAVSPGSSGDILSSPPGAITCPGDCTEAYLSGTSVTITAAPRAGYNFSSWTGGVCGATSQPSTCLLTMNGNTTETANFVAAPAFNYSISSTVPLGVTKGGGDVYTSNTITKTLTSGTAQLVTVSLSGVPTCGTTPACVEYSISGNPGSPTVGGQQSTVTFTIHNTAVPATYPITATGDVLAGKTTGFNLVIQPSSAITVTCDGDPDTALLGETITWSALASGGTGNYSYLWNGDIPSPAPTTASFITSYSTIGTKTVDVTVTDDGGSAPANCTPADPTVLINFNPSFEEF